MKIGSRRLLINLILPRNFTTNIAIMSFSFICDTIYEFADAFTACNIIDNYKYQIHFKVCNIFQKFFRRTIESTNKIDKLNLIHCMPCIHR